VDNVLDDVVQELGVVGDDDGCARRGGEVVLEPLDVLDIQMVGGLVEEQNIGLLEHSTRKRELHLPSSGKGGDGTVVHVVGETELVESGLDFVLGNADANRLELLQGPGNNGLLSVRGVEIVLNVDGLDLALLGETLDLLVVDSTHEGGLSGTVGSEETVTLTTLQTEMGLVKQNLGTVGQVECAVAEVLALLLIRLDNVGLHGLGQSLLAEVLGDVLSLLLANEDSDEGTGVSLPVETLVVLLVDELTTDGTNVVDNRSETLVDLELGWHNILELAGNGGNVTILGQLGDLAVLNVTDTDKSVETLAGLLTSLGVSQVVVVLLKRRHQLGQESGNNLGILDKLAHVVDNDSSLTLDGSLALNETTLEQGNHDGKGGLVDVSDESGGTEQVNGLGDVLRLGDTLDELGNEALDILVGDQGAESLHGGVSGLLDLRLGVPHGTRDDGDQVWDTESHLCGGALGEDLNALQVGHLFGPLLCSLERLDDVGDDGLDGVGVCGSDDGLSGGLGSDLDAAHLVADSGEDGGEELDKVGLDCGGDVGVLGDGADGIESALAGDGILLAGELLLQQVDGPVMLLEIVPWRGSGAEIVHVLGGSVSLLNVTVDEGGDSLSSRVDLVLLLGDGQLAQELLEGLDSLRVLGLDGRGVVKSSGSHVVGGEKKVEGGWRSSGVGRAEVFI
jgi:hypothetical protein